MADAEWASALSVQPGFGLPDALRRVESVAGRGDTTSWADGTLGTRRAAIAAELMGQASWALHNQLSDGDFDEANDDHSVTINYAVELQSTQLQRSAGESVVLQYPKLPSYKECRVSHVGRQEQTLISSQIEAEESLEMHMQGVNAYTTTGVAREALFNQSSRLGCELTSVFVRMWLAHLSVNSGCTLEVFMDYTRLRGNLAAEPLDRECDAARLLPGVRVNNRGFDELSLALFKVGCSSFSDLAGLHDRARRYKFKTVRLSVYGNAHLPPSRNITLTRERNTGAAIVSIAHRYGVIKQCSEALRASLVMYGISMAGRKMALHCAEPDLHDDTHSAAITGSSPYDRTTDLGEKRLLSLSLFLGRMWRQSMGHVLRAGLSKVAATDVDAARSSVLPNHITLIASSAKLHREATLHYCGLIDNAAFMLDNYASLWSERGLIHSVACGVIVKGSVAEEAVMPIAVPMVETLSPADDPSIDLDRVWGVMTLVDSLLRDCGETLRGSWIARVDRLDDQLDISDTASNLCGCTVQFTVLSIGSSLRIQRGERGFNLPPPMTMDPETAARPMTAATPLQDTLNHTSDVGDSTDLDKLIGQYQPKGSTMRHVPREPYASSAPTEAIIVDPRNERDLVEKMAREKVGVIPTSGEGLMCGANAIGITLDAMGEATDRDLIVTALQEALTDEDRERARVGGVSLEYANFTVDQMAAGVAQLGNYDLVVIQETETGAVMTRHGRDDTIRVPVVVHHRDNHWSGVGPGGPRRVTPRRNRRA